MGWWVIFAGLVGALVSVILQWWIQRQRLRAELTITVVAWLDETFRELVALRHQRVAAQTSPKLDYMTDEQYREYKADVHHRMCLAEIPIRLTLLYGKGEELIKFNELRNEMDKAYRILVDSETDGTINVSANFDELFITRIDSLRKDLQKRLLRRTIPQL